MLIRNCFPEDLVALTGLVNSLWHDDSLWGPSRLDGYAPGPRRTVLVAEDYGRVAGAASLQHSRLSAHGVLQLDVHPQHRGRGVGQALMGRMREIHPGWRMMVRVRPWDEAAVVFYQAMGFDVAERAIEGQLDPSEPAIADWIERAVAAATPPLVVRRFDQADPLIEEIALALDAWFRRHHPWLPLAPRPVGEAVETFVLPSIPGTGRVALDNEEVVGAGVLIRDPFGLSRTAGHLAYLGTAATRPDEAEVVGALVAACLGSAAAQERRVQVEISSRHRAGWKVIQSLPCRDLYEGLVVFVR